MTDRRPSRWLSATADLLWPSRCVCCNRRLPTATSDPLSGAFCARCAETLILAGSPRCPRCASSYGAPGVDHECGACLSDAPPFASTRSVFLYGGAVADAISRFKYGAASWIAAPLGRVLATIDLEPRPSVIVPVPLHPRRIAKRGFNQSALLAAEVARRHALPLDTGALRRVVDTAPQVRQARSERLRSLRSAFAVHRRGRIAGAGVVLVDDVVTTTATVRAASAALIEAGAAWVNVISLARAEWPERVADRGQTR